MKLSNLESHWFAMSPGFIRHESLSAKCVQFVYEPTWEGFGAVPKRICIRSDLKVAKRSPNAFKMHPNCIRIDMIISEICFSIPHVNRRCFIKPLTSIGKLNVFWKRIFVYTEWLHSDCKVMPNWTNITFISKKWHQSHFKMIPKWAQSAPKVTRLARLEPVPNYS